MNVRDLISILQQQDPAAIVVQLDYQTVRRHGIMKLGVGEVQPIWVTGEEDIGLVWLKPANKDSPGAAPAVLLGEVL